MSSYLSELKAAMAAAFGQAELSNAKRLKVGAVLMIEGRPLSNGRNGMPSGFSNTCEEYVQDGPVAELVTKKQVVHAEMNAIAFAAAKGVATEGSTLVITHSPCYDCSKLIIQARIKEVVYSELYRDEEPLTFLEEAGIKVERLRLKRETTSSN